MSLEKVQHIVKEIDCELQQEDFTSYKSFRYCCELKFLKRNLLAGSNKMVSVLFDCIYEQHLLMIQFLLRMGVDIHAREYPINETVLHAAARGGNPEVMQLLMTNGAMDVMATNNNGQIPLDLVDKRECCEESEYYEDCIKCVKMLIRHMVLLECKDSYYTCHYKPHYLSYDEYQRYIVRRISFRRQCQVELETMKKLKIGQGLTLYKFITTKDLTHYVRGKNLQRDVQALQHNRYFVIYDDIIVAKFKEAMERLHALEVSDIVISHFLIPDLAYILSDYLENDDIKKLREAAIQAKKKKKNFFFFKQVMSCKISDESFYDLEQLAKIKLTIDPLIRHIADQQSNLERYTSRNVALPMFYDVTYDLVKQFKNDALEHIRYILKNNYGILYLLADRSHYNSMDINYRAFPLIRDENKVWKEIESMAAEYFPYHETLKYDITCLYLIYFYGLLINPHSNWITMDYITNGNRYHQYQLLEMSGLWPNPPPPLQSDSPDVWVKKGLNVLVKINKFII